MYLTALIYTYARRLMIEVYKYNVIMTDTDSALLKSQDYLRMRKDHPEWFGSEFGLLTHEKGCFMDIK